MKQININLKKENLRDTMRLTRQEKNALKKYCSSPEFKAILRKNHIPQSRTEIEADEALLLAEKS